LKKSNNGIPAVEKKVTTASLPLKKSNNGIPAVEKKNKSDYAIGI